MVSRYLYILKIADYIIYNPVHQQEYFVNMVIIYYRNFNKNKLFAKFLNFYSCISLECFHYLSRQFFSTFRLAFAYRLQGVGVNLENNSLLPNLICLDLMALYFSILLIMCQDSKHGHSYLEPCTFFLVQILFWEIRHP